VRWRDVGEQTCSVARALSVVGDRWTLLVLREAFLGRKRFDDFQQAFDELYDPVDHARRFYDNILELFEEDK